MAPRFYCWGKRGRSSGIVCPEQAEQQVPGDFHGVGDHEPEESPVDDVPAIPFEAVAEGVVFLVTGKIHGGGGGW